MQIGSRFAEYGLTGGFFWICQLFFLVYSGGAKTLLSHLPTVQLELPSSISQLGFSTAISTLVSALAIIAVFIAGLVLDLAAVYFRRNEMVVFQQHLARNRDWLGRLVANHKAYCEADYEEFERQFSETSPATDARPRLGISLFWNRERRQQYVAALKRKSGMQHAYERLWSFFASYVLVESGSSQLSLMVDQYYLWRAGRAVSISLVILMAEVALFTTVSSVFHTPPHIRETSWHIRETSWFPALFAAVVPALFNFAAVVLVLLITRETYSRLCYTLFALVYVTQDTRNADLVKTA